MLATAHKLSSPTVVCFKLLAYLEVWATQNYKVISHHTVLHKCEVTTRAYTRKLAPPGKDTYSRPDRSTLAYN
jgi:hypothetical protein